MNAISFYKIGKSFNGKKVLESVSFSVDEGESVALIGKNGSGKSTICNIISRLIIQDYGDIFVKNDRIRTMKQFKSTKIGFMLSQDYLIDEFTIEKYLFNIGILCGFTKDYLLSRIDYLLDILKFEEVNTDIGNLSSGGKMLVKIAFMLLGDPDILVLDEPFINLDLNYRIKIQDLLISFNKNGKTILIISHFPEHIYAVAERILVLKNGEINDEILPSAYLNYESFYNKISDNIANPMD